MITIITLIVAKIITRLNNKCKHLLQHLLELFNVFNNIVLELMYKPNLLP